jgi:hypothetical protein
VNNKFTVPFLPAGLPAPAPLASSAVLLPPCLLVRWEVPAQEPWQQGLQQQKSAKKVMHEAEKLSDDVQGGCLGAQ